MVSDIFSTTLKVSNNEKCWNTMPMPNFLAAAEFFRFTTLPFQLMDPLSASTMPYTSFISVDLPAPFSPNTAWMEPV